MVGGINAHIALMNEVLKLDCGMLGKSSKTSLLMRPGWQYLNPNSLEPNFDNQMSPSVSLW